MTEPKPKPLSKLQRAALLAAKDGKVCVYGRGCKATINGLAYRDLIDRARLNFPGSGSGYWGKLTPRGEEVAEALRREEGEP